VGNYVLTLHHTRCPDGAEFIPHPWVAGTTVRFPSKLLEEKGRAGLPEDQRSWPVIRFRSERREDYRRRLETPDKLMVTEFLNTVPWVEDDSNPNTEEMDYGLMLEFIGEYGFPLHLVSTNQLIQELKDKSPEEREAALRAFNVRSVSEPDEKGERLAYVVMPPEITVPDREMSLLLLIQIRESLHRIWKEYETGNINDAVETFRNNALPEISNVYPDIEFRNGKPTLTLPIATPYGFMLMETALVMTGGSQVARCSKCGTIYVTGSGTGRRGTALYCSNRCRVAAQRSRKSTPASSAEDVMTDEEKLEKIAAGVRGAVRE
jgi:hypothetical protein